MKQPHIVIKLDAELEESDPPVHVIHDGGTVEIVIEDTVVLLSADLIDDMYNQIFCGSTMKEHLDMVRHDLEDLRARGQEPSNDSIMEMIEHLGKCLER